MNLIKSLNWRYATKKFDATKKVSSADLEQLKEAIQLSASSFGLQLYKVLIVENEEVKRKLLPVSYGQEQVFDCSHLFVFCGYNKSTSDEQIAAHIKNTATTRNVPEEALKGYGEFMQTTLGRQSEESFTTWSAKQTYIALGNLLAACGELNIDSCPMEGFDPKAYNELLDLDKQNLQAALICPVGYRHQDDATQHGAKVRKAMSDLFEVV